jgi:hypothetical protein
MFAEDVSVFFTDFAETVNIGGTDTQAIFDSPYSAAGVGMGMDSNTPSLTLATINVPSSPLGLPVTVRSVAYVVAQHLPDGTGVSRLLLEQV